MIHLILRFFSSRWRRFIHHLAFTLSKDTINKLKSIHDRELRDNDSKHKEERERDKADAQELLQTITRSLEARIEKNKKEHLSLTSSNTEERTRLQHGINLIQECDKALHAAATNMNHNADFLLSRVQEIIQDIHRFKDQQSDAYEEVLGVVETNLQRAMADLHVGRKRKKLEVRQ